MAPSGDPYGNIRVNYPVGGKLHRGIGGKRNYIQGGCYAESGAVIIAATLTGNNGITGIFDALPAEKIASAVLAHRVTAIIQSGTLAPRDPDLGELAGGKVHLAARETRAELLWTIRKQPLFQRPEAALRQGLPVLTPNEEAVEIL